MLETEIHKNFGTFQLNVSFSSRCRRIGILGASGCGKSMTLKSIAGIITPDHGYIKVGDHVLYDSENGINIPVQKRRVGYLFQNYALFPNMTVAKNIGCGLQTLPRSKRRQRVEEMIDKFELKGLESRLPDQLSGGQQQRTALARIMAYQPDVILLDEPFSALDAYLKDKLQEEMKQMLSDYQGIVILVSHNRDEVYRFSDDLIIMNQGKVDTFGNVKEIFASPKTRKAAVLTGCKNYSHARRLDDHTFQAVDWGITVHTQMVLPELFSWIGYRAHDFIPTSETERADCIHVQLYSMAALPFERNYYIVPPGIKEYTQDDMITWMVQRDEWDQVDQAGLPAGLLLQEDRILFLQ